MGTNNFSVYLKPINLLRRWNPTMEINTNTKIAKGPWTTRQTDILYCHSGALSPWPAAACTVRNYGPRFYDRQKVTRMTINRYRETYKLEWTPMGSFGPQCGDNSSLRESYCETPQIPTFLNRSETILSVFNQKRPYSY